MVDRESTDGFPSFFFNQASGSHHSKGLNLNYDGRPDAMNKQFSSLIKKMDKYQKAYYQSLLENSMTCCNARAGTGKTTIAIMAGLQMLEEGKVRQLIYLRFPDQLVQSLGHFPGTLEEKEQVYMGPFFNSAFKLGYTAETIYRRFIDQELIQLCTSVTFRGNDLNSVYLIIDEAQNGLFKDIKMVLTRLNDDCHCAFIGHSDQCDTNKARTESAFAMYIHHMCKLEGVKECRLVNNYRGKLSQWADSLMVNQKGEYYISKE